MAGDLMRVGFFGGTFNPIHFGHLNLALHLSEIHQLDLVHFSPASLSPHKEKEASFVEGLHRLEMVRLAIEPISHFLLDQKEVTRTGVSYTIDAIRALKDVRPADHLFLLIGDDTLSRLHEWKDVDALLELAAPLIGCRTRTSANWEGFSEFARKRIAKGRTRIPLMEISSTLLRERLCKGLYCGHLIPGKVLDYIRDNNLYSSP